MTPNVNLPTADISLCEMLRTRSAIATELAVMPAEIEPDAPWCVIYPMYSVPMYGDFSNGNSMGDLPYQLSVGGHSYMQVITACQRMLDVLAVHWPDVQGCCGPPEVARGATLRDQDRLYRAILTVTLKVSGT